MPKNNAVCSICGKEYYMCLSCKSFMSLYPWKAYTDTSEHYKIYQIVRGFVNEVYTKKEAKEKLQNVDLTDFEDLQDYIKDILKDILNYKDEQFDTSKVIKMKSNSGKHVVKQQKVESVNDMG